MKYGEYVRDKDGIIIKVNEIQEYKEDDDIWYEEKILKGTWKSMVVKHSKNIIDLVEVGDYVNGCKVLYKVANMYLMVSTSDFSNNKIFNYMIKSILTKEMYEQNVFKVVE